ncbi:transcription elongation factor GreA [bacterium]|nr:transcription elongation factor GreA [bacterium]
MKPMYLSKEQFDKLTSELAQMKREDRNKAIRDIAEAREKGDLSENAEYHAAKEKQALVERKIARLEETLSRARIMTDDMMNNDQVHVGSRVTLMDVKTKRQIAYELVPTAEFHTYDVDAVSVDSPVGKALVGKKVNDIVEIKIPAGLVSYRIVNIQ